MILQIRLTSNYYKTMSIGLVNADHLDTIIAWLKGTGVVIFSNEADKYYNAKNIWTDRL